MQITHGVWYVLKINASLIKCVCQADKEGEADRHKERGGDRQSKKRNYIHILRPSNVVRPATLKPENGALCFPFLPSS